MTDSDLDKKLALAEERATKRSLSKKIREKVEAAVAAGDSRIVPPFRTIPRVLRPRAVNRAALRKIDVSLKAVWPLDSDRKVGMRGVPVGQRVTRRPGPPRIKGGVRAWMEHRATRRARRLTANASRRANR